MRHLYDNTASLPGDAAAKVDRRVTLDPPDATSDQAGVRLFQDALGQSPRSGHTDE
jgi:hypothetical protein